MDRFKEISLESCYFLHNTMHSIWTISLLEDSPISPLGEKHSLVKLLDCRPWNQILIPILWGIFHLNIVAPMWHLFSIPSYPTDTLPIQIRDKILRRHKKAHKYHKKISTLTLFTSIGSHLRWHGMLIIPLPSPIDRAT